MKSDHIRIGNTDTGAHAFICTHCGDIYVPSLPCSVDMFLTMSRQFGKEHRKCAKPASGALDAVGLLYKAGLRRLSVSEIVEDASK